MHFILLVIFFISSIIMILMFIFKEQVIDIAGLGFDKGVTKLTLDLYIVILPIILFYPILYLSVAALNAYRI